LSALFADSEFWIQQRLSRSGAEANDDFGFNQTNLSLKPRPASGNFSGVRFFMNASLAARFPFEMLDDVGDVS